MSDPAPEGQGDSESHSTKPARVFTGPVRLYLLARFSGSTSFQIQGVAVGWYIYQLTNCPLQLGLVGLAMFLPTVSLALFAGHAIDRFQRRRVLLCAWSAQACAAAAIGLLALFHVDSVFWIYALIACIGAGRSFEQPAQAALLPSLVPVALFPRVTPAGSLVNQFAVIIGPALGGLLFIFGAPVAFFGSVTMLWSRSPPCSCCPARRRVPPSLCRGTASSAAFISSAAPKRCAARSPSTCSACSSAAPPRCCRSSRATS